MPDIVASTHFRFLPTKSDVLSVYQLGVRQLYANAKHWRPTDTLVSNCAIPAVEMVLYNASTDEWKLYTRVKSYSTRGLKGLTVPLLTLVWSTNGNCWLAP